MRVSVSEAKGQLTDLVRRAEAGEDIVLTRHNRDVARLAPIQAKLSSEEKCKAIEAICKAAAGKSVPGPSAARSQDFLYDDDGLPG